MCVLTGGGGLGSEEKKGDGKTMAELPDPRRHHSRMGDERKGRQGGKALRVREEEERNRAEGKLPASHLQCLTPHSHPPSGSFLLQPRIVSSAHSMPLTAPTWESLNSTPYTNTLLLSITGCVDLGPFLSHLGLSFPFCEMRISDFYLIVSVWA